MQKRRENKVIFEMNCVTQEMPIVILINTSILLMPAKTSNKVREREVDEVKRDADI